MRSVFQWFCVLVASFETSLYCSGADVPSKASKDISLFRTECIAFGSLSGESTDQTGLTKQLEDGTPSDRAGGFSAIEYTGEGNDYWVLSDRGPADGAASFPCRIQRIELNIDTATNTINPTLRGTVFLSDEKKRPLVGALSVLPKKGRGRGLAFDPEGLRLHPEGGFIISDEYGPSLEMFSAGGHKTGSWGLPEWFALNKDKELAKATVGTMPNRGIEGLALSSSGDSILAAMQGPLVQDSEAQGKKRYAQFTRLMEIELNTASPARHFLYPLEDARNGVSEILAYSDHEYLVLERDGETRPDARFKAIYFIDVSPATDVANRSQLSPWSLTDGLSTVSKSLFIDLLDPALSIPVEHRLEKPEGLAWGPLLSDGRRLLIVCFDNDFRSNADSLFLAFAISTSP
jgi:hypothetical protein